jgi:hypothetical protein
MDGYWEAIEACAKNGYTSEYQQFLEESELLKKTKTANFP